MSKAGRVFAGLVLLAPLIAIFHNVIGPEAAAQGVSVIQANQGAPGKYGPWPVTISNNSADGGIIVSVASTSCGSPANSANTDAGTSVITCPTTRTTGSNWIMICNDGTNLTGNLKVRVDGQSPTFPGPGITLRPYDCYADYVPTTQTIKCLADSAGVSVSFLECAR